MLAVVDALPDLRGVLCPVCGYDQSGAVELRCVECGYELEELDYAGDERRRLFLRFTRSTPWWIAALVLLLTTIVAAPMTPVVASYFIVPFVLFRRLPRQHRKTLRRVWVITVGWLHLPWLVWVLGWKIGWSVERWYDPLAAVDTRWDMLSVTIIALSMVCIGAIAWHRTYARLLPAAGLSSGVIGRPAVQRSISIMILLTCMPMVVYVLARTVAVVLDEVYPGWAHGW